MMGPSTSNRIGGITDIQARVMSGLRSRADPCHCLLQRGKPRLNRGQHGAERRVTPFPRAGNHHRTCDWAGYLGQRFALGFSSYSH